MSGTAGAPATLSIRPNPFTGWTEIRFALAEPGDVALEIFDAAGRRVRTVLRQSLSAGDHAAGWDGRSDDGRPVGPGVYLSALRTAGRAVARKMIILP